jgi:Mrp family chromosome partitioning ATPase
VTGGAEGSGLSTVASGLAASHSETGEGRVLLVNMDNAGSKSVHNFFRGGLDLSLDDALIEDRRDEAKVQENLYVASGNGQDDHLDRILHKRFTTLVPRLKASDYDYIIFDMPPVSPISSTLKVARFMDMVMLVVESEKDDADAAKQAAERLAKHQTSVSVVLNKTRNYVPRMLQQETLT